MGLKYFFICLLLLLILVALGFNHSVQGGKEKILPAFKTSVLTHYKPKTGDIFMMHYFAHGMIGIPVAEHWPTHTGLVWVREDKQAFVIECTKFSAPTLPNVLDFTKDKERGVRVVPIAEFINSIDNVLYVRKLIKGKFSSKKVEKILDKWAKHIDFETRIADTMTFDLTVAIGFAAVWPKLSEWCARFAGLDRLEKRQNQAFCSEFVSKFLQKLGAIKPDFQEHYRMSPASFLSTTSSLENIADPRYAWGKDLMLVRNL